jgi:antitoxin component of MazEF toxin-antitoxin module|tara:strand:- start:427 stop:618 length:192 start_codon:yes stop_codon:yes gene_type:complete
MSNTTCPRENWRNMKLQEGLSKNHIYIPERLWNALGWKIGEDLEVKVRKIEGKNTLIITRRKK